MANLKYNKEATKCCDCGKPLAVRCGFISKQDGECRCCYCYTSAMPPMKFVFGDGGVSKKKSDIQTE